MGGFRMAKAESHGMTAVQQPNGISGTLEISGCQHGKQRVPARWRSARLRCGSNVTVMRMTKLFSIRGAKVEAYTIVSTVDNWFYVLALWGAGFRQDCEFIGECVLCQGR